VAANGNPVVYRFRLDNVVIVEDEHEVVRESGDVVDQNRQH
jgi:hypothetical protein